MRRPMKPFVTEYKPSTRRQLAPARQPQSFATEPAKPGEGARFDTASRNGESYEAALRAADALFSPQKDKAQPSSDHVGDDMAETYGSRDAAGRGNGRILRVLDEPPPGPTSEMMDELERERAPKRRGRKPGSKNRPKADRPTTPFPTTVATAPDVQIPHPRSMSEPAMPASAIDGTAHEQPAAAGRSDHGHPREHHADGQDDGSYAVAEDVAGPVSAIPARARRRFSWVRTKLKPGQDWKRRLPKVCW